MAAALAGARRPVCHFSGDDLRGLDADALVERSAGARTAALGGTGFSHVADLLVHAHPGLVVLDPLAVALDVCLAAIAAAGRRMP